MQKKTLLLLILIIFLSCNKTTKVVKQIDSTSVNKEILKSETESEISTESKTQNWYDGLIANYIIKSDNELIKLALKNKEHVEWLQDRTEKTDSTNYYIFQIG